jgi:hypothetical protein
VETIVANSDNPPIRDVRNARSLAIDVHQRVDGRFNESLIFGIRVDFLDGAVLFDAASETTMLHGILPNVHDEP